MRRTWLILAAALMTLGPMSASAAVRGRVVIGRRVAVGRPFYGGWYRPFWGPYWGPYGAPYYGSYYLPNSGEIKLDTKVKDAQVYINGAYAGTTHQNKTMYLRPGSYKLEIKEAGRTQYAERVYVTAGKTLHIRPEL
jgi:hypothetical protein